MFFRVESITVYYETVTALRDVSMKSDQGEIVALIGSNGAGKTTTLRAISGLIKITSGEIWLDRQKISGLPPQKIVALGVVHVPEGRRVFPYMKVGENLYMGAFHRRDRKGIRKDLEMVLGLFPILKERFHQQAGKLSGGEQQMLAIGRGLMSRPRLLLLDEPSLGLSPMMTRSIANTIVEINGSNRVTIILVEQNARMALNLARRGYVIETGRIVLEDDSDKILNNDDVKRFYLGA